MLTEEVSTKDQQDFDVIYGTIFSLATVHEFLEGVQGIMGERKANYARNKAREAQTACKFVHDLLLREITKRMTPEQRAIAECAVEEHRNIIYDFFMLTNDHQRRVKGLIKKLKDEEFEAGN